MKINIIKEIFWLCLGIMKQILDLYEYKVGKNSEEFRYFKKEVMNSFYNGLNKFYSNLEKQGIVKKCSCDSKIRKGYNKCNFCGGSGFKEI